MADVYIKKGRKYEPIGIHFNHSWLSDGVYVVRRKKGVTNVTNVALTKDMYCIEKVGDNPVVDLSLIAGLENYIDAVAAEIASDKNSVLTASELARRILGAIINESKKVKNDEKDSVF